MVGRTDMLMIELRDFSFWLLMMTEAFSLSLHLWKMVLVCFYRLDLFKEREELSCN